MNKKVFFVLHCFYMCTSGNLTVRGCGESILPKIYEPVIIGGTEARHGEYPWVVSLQSRGRHFCGGSIINKYWIITAAHCVSEGAPKDFQVLAGLHELSESSSPTVQHLKIFEIVVHKDYDEETYTNDIALMKTTKPIDIAGSRGYVNAICPPHTNKDPIGFAKVVGWGYTARDVKSRSDTLMEVSVPIVDRDMCNESYEKEYGKVSETMICAGMELKDSCTYDSGGPLFQTDSAGVSSLIGIVSYGVDCGNKLYPGVYTKVSEYLPWIKKVTKSF